MDRKDILGDQPERRRAFSRELLAETEDEVLQAIVEKAARELHAPIALVTMVLDKIQFFKAHHGLTGEQAAARSTSRDVSFCQFVVRGGKEFEVNDAAVDERVPREGFRTYGFRSYLGIPIRIDDVVIGSLCVIDQKPRSFGPEEHEIMNRLAEEVNQRVRQLAESRRNIRLALSQEVSGPGIAELLGAIGPIRDYLDESKQALQTLRTFLRLSLYLQKGGLPSAETMSEALEAARGAADTLENLLYETEASVCDAHDCATALEYLSDPLGKAVLSAVLCAAQDLSRRAITTAGGMPLPDLATDPCLATTRALSVALVTTCLNLLGPRLAEPHGAGIRLKVEDESDEVRLTFHHPGLTHDISTKVIAEMEKRLQADPSFLLEAAEGAVSIRFATL